jgi:1,4-dihydroxy-2-naphthoate octaprenyltransferase
VVGSDYVQTGDVRLPALLASVSPGLLAVAILVANNLRDVETDRAAGKRTLAVRLGVPATRVQYAFCMAGALAVPGLMRALGMLGGWFWLPWLAAPLMGILIHAVFTRTQGAWQIWVLKRPAAAVTTARSSHRGRPRAELPLDAVRLDAHRLRQRAATHAARWR